MDNKLTKKRLSDFLAYEWIIMLVVAAVSMICWELIYSFFEVRITVGQSYKYYYDEGVYSMGSGEFYKLINDDVFSYDILELSYESLDSSYNVLSARLSIQEGDSIFSDTHLTESGTNRANWIIDGYKMYDLNKLATDCEEYLKTFLIDGKSDVTDFNNLDKEKIADAFYKRADSERVYKNALKEGLISDSLEYERIERLCRDLADYKKILVLGEEIGLFYKYTRYSQSKDNCESRELEEFTRLYDREVQNGRENANYGINLSALKNGKEDISMYARAKDSGLSDASETVFMVFDFLSYQPELQFESISLINKIVKTCSDIL